MQTGIRWRLKFWVSVKMMTACKLVPHRFLMERNGGLSEYKPDFGVITAAGVKELP